MKRMIDRKKEIQLILNGEMELIESVPVQIGALLRNGYSSCKRFVL